MILGATTVVLTAIAEPGRINITQSTDEKGKTTYFMVSNEMVAKCPAWNEEQEPPLSIRQAITKARDWVKKKYPAFSVSNVNSVCMGKIWEHKILDRWYYSIGIEGRVAVNGIDAIKHFEIVVLMDGSIVEPSDKEE